MSNQMFLGTLLAQFTTMPTHLANQTISAQKPSIDIRPVTQTSALDTATHGQAQQKELFKHTAAPVFNATIKTNLAYSFDKEAGTTVFKVVDSTTKKIIRQIPPEESLRITKRIKKLLQQPHTTGSILDSEG